MQTEINEAPHAARVAALKGFGAGALVIGLIALMVMAVFRETAKPPQQADEISVPAQAGRPAMTAAEEKYARALWAIHAQVKQDAVRMTFAGLAYKMGDIKQGAVKERVAPLKLRFHAALITAGKLEPPVSMKGLHRDYLNAIKLYRDSSVVMIRVAEDGRDGHLIEAQEMSEKASGLTLKVGETLWPGEYKPN
jgi:hypothetical protein